AKPNPDLALLAKIGDRQHEAGERTLHVVCAAPVETIAVDARLKLLGPAGHDVEVAVQEDRVRSVLGPDLSDGHRQIPDPDLAGHDVPGVQPALDEPGAQPDALRRG